MEVDGKMYELEGGNRPPSEQEARNALSQFKEPSFVQKNLLKPALQTQRAMQITGEMLPGTRQFLDMERQQAQQKAMAQNVLLNRFSRFPEARGIGAELINYIPTSSMVIAGGVLGAGGGQLLGKMAKIPTTRRFLMKQFPTKHPLMPTSAIPRYLEKHPIQPQYKEIGGMQVDITRPLPQRGNIYRTDYITQELFPRAQKAIKSNIERFTPGIERFAREKLKIPQSAINTIKKKGIGAIETTRNMLDDNLDNLYQRIVQGVENKRLQADSFYRAVVDRFQGTINASSFRQKLGQILRQKGWLDQTGKPTARFGAKLDSTLDDLTRLHQDLRTIYKGKVIKGLQISKEDFSTYRDMLGRLLRDRPSDVSIMQLRNALYSSAERSGMKGIIQARDMERIANQVEQSLVKKGLIGEKGLNQFHNMTKEQIRQLKELEYYIQEPFIDDLSSLTAAKELDKIYKISEDIPGQVNPIANQLMQATNPKMFNYIKQQLQPFLGNATENIFRDLAAHRFATGVKTAGKWGLGLGTSALGYSLLRRPIIRAIEELQGGGEFGGSGY